MAASPAGSGRLSGQDAPQDGRARNVAIDGWIEPAESRSKPAAAFLLGAAYYRLLFFHLQCRDDCRAELVRQAEFQISAVRGALITLADDVAAANLLSELHRKLDDIREAIDRLPLQDPALPGGNVLERADRDLLVSFGCLNSPQLETFFKEVDIGEDAVDSLVSGVGEWLDSPAGAAFTAAYTTSTGDSDAQAHRDIQHLLARILAEDGPLAGWLTFGTTLSLHWLKSFTDRRRLADYVEPIVTVLIDRVPDHCCEEVPVLGRLSAIADEIMPSWTPEQKEMRFCKVLWTAPGDADSDTAISWQPPAPHVALATLVDMIHEQLAATAELTEIAPEGPHWDRKNRKLYLDGKEIKKFKQSATSQMLVLDCFQSCNWQETVGRPPIIEKNRSVLDNLNTGLQHAVADGKVLHFDRDGRGGVRWELSNSTDDV